MPIPWVTIGRKVLPYAREILLGGAGGYVGTQLGQEGEGGGAVSRPGAGYQVMRPPVMGLARNGYAQALEQEDIYKLRYAFNPRTAKLDALVPANGVWLFQDTHEVAKKPHYKFSERRGQFVILKTRRMNPLNQRALARAHRRALGFDCFVKRNFAVLDTSCRFRRKTRKRCRKAPCK